MKNVLLTILIIFTLAIIGYSIVGTSVNVEKIKKIAPSEMQKRNWKILRYEGFQYGSWGQNGGKVWYHVANIDNPNIQYRVYITLWNNELQYTYGEPEILNRVQVDYQK